MLHHDDMMSTSCWHDVDIMLTWCRHHVDMMLHHYIMLTWCRRHVDFMLTWCYIIMSCWHDVDMMLTCMDFMSTWHGHDVDIDIYTIWLCRKTSCTCLCCVAYLWKLLAIRLVVEGESGHQNPPLALLCALVSKVQIASMQQKRLARTVSILSEAIPYTLPMSYQE